MKPKNFTKRQLRILKSLITVESLSLAMREQLAGRKLSK